MDIKSSLKFFDGDLIVDNKKTEHLFLMGSWWPTVFICALYCLVVNVFSKYMKSRPAFELRGLLIGYNVAMVAWSAYMFLAFVVYGLRTGFSVHCWPLGDGEAGAAEGLAVTFWLYFLSKLVELLDTVFFIARRNFRLVTVLHVYHHVVMPVTTWLAVKYSPGGFMTTPFSLNCLIHVFMYAYYGLAAAGLHRHLWWKKYMTMAQITQFLVIIAHSVYFLSLDCHYPRSLVLIILVNAAIFLSLFLNYFLTARKTTPEECRPVKID